MMATLPALCIMGAFLSSTTYPETLTTRRKESFRMIATRRIPDFSEQDKLNFWASAEKSDGCWMWKKCINESGYGIAAHKRLPYRASRIAWFLTHGQPGQLLVLHKCDNPACVNPEHLFLGTHADNSADMAKKGRSVYQQHPEKAARGDRHWSRRMPHLRAKGEGHGCAKLTAKDIPLIRSLGKTENCQTIADCFKVNKSTINRILSGRLWTHL